MTDLKGMVKGSLSPWLLSRAYEYRHLFRIVYEGWLADRQRLMDEAHIAREWNFERPVEVERHSRALNAVFRELPAEKRVHALEIGCSEGVFTRKLAARCASVTAYDISQLACARAAERCADLPNVSIRQFDLERDLIQAQYECVFAMDVLEYVHGRRRLARVVEKLAKAVKPDGLLAITIFCLEGQLPGAWWMHWFPEGGHALVKFIADRSGLQLVQKGYHPDDGVARPGYPSHIVAVFAKSRLATLGLCEERGDVLTRVGSDAPRTHS